MALPTPERATSRGAGSRGRLRAPTDAHRVGPLCEVRVRGPPVRARITAEKGVRRPLAVGQDPLPQGSGGRRAVLRPGYGDAVVTGCHFRPVVGRGAPLADPVSCQPDGVGHLLPARRGFLVTVGARRRLRMDGQILLQGCGRPRSVPTRVLTGLVGRLGNVTLSETGCALPGNAVHSAAFREVAKQHFHELTPVTLTLKSTHSSHLGSVE